MPFSATVTTGQSAFLPQCGAVLIAGTVTDRDGESLTGYPVHVWGPVTDTIVLSGSALAYGDSGWAVRLPGETNGEGNVWYVQLHHYDIEHVHPPLSAAVRVELPARCPQAVIRFKEQQ